jgi:EAL domain-containing protein (putative c-di-GMP-specific phosphodiesterase class I)
VFDVDKRMVLSSLENARMLNRNIKKLKMEFALNHCTETDNSANFLPSIKIDYMKISPDLIHNLEQNKVNQTAVSTIVRRAQQKGMKTMACGVESLETMSQLYQAGIDYLQGNALAELSSVMKQEVFGDMM